MSTYGIAGDLLIRAGVVDARGVSQAIEVQSQLPSNGTSLGRALASLGLAGEAAVAATLASALHLEHIDGQPPPVR